MPEHIKCAFCAVNDAKVHKSFLSPPHAQLKFRSERAPPFHHPITMMQTQSHRVQHHRLVLNPLESSQDWTAGLSTSNNNNHKFPY